LDGAGFLQLLEAGDANLEKFVKYGARNTQEADPHKPMPCRS